MIKTLFTGFSLAVVVAVVASGQTGSKAQPLPGLDAPGTKVERAGTTPAARPGAPAAVAGRQGKAPANRHQPAQDDDMAEIEALLKSRGIE